MESKITTLLGLVAYHFTSEGLKQELQPMRKEIPSYVLLDDKRFGHCEEVFACTVPDNQEFILFDTMNVNPILDEEMSSYGLCELFDHCDEKDIEWVFSHLHIQSFNDYGRCIPNVNYIVIEVIYTSTYDNYYGGYEHDVEYVLKGVLSSSMEFIPLPTRPIPVAE